MKAVSDTNIFISAFVIPGSKAEEAYLRALKGDFALYSSVAILTETAQKLSEKFGWPQSKITQLLRTIAKVATVIRTQPHLHLFEDEPVTNFFNEVETFTRGQSAQLELPCSNLYLLLAEGDVSILSQLESSLLG